MRYILFFLVTSIAWMPAHSAPSNENCGGIIKPAQLAMAFRQQGKPRSTANSVAKDQPERIAKVFRSMVDAAYRYPIMDVESDQKKIVNYFGERAYLRCREHPKQPK